ncbi:MAG: barstar family protein [Oscillospiraceae bacterium]|nr:barstar family protein [Oscillospiraceae bacterium]
MRTIVLDCRLLGGDTAEERRATHERLAEAFGFPSYYGFNLDALYDCLTDPCEETEVILTHSDGEWTEGYCGSVIEVLCESAAENRNLKLFRTVEFTA